ncbi:hypothetical protein [Streptomyces sp. SGAir0957]
MLPLLRKATPEHPVRVLSRGERPDAEGVSYVTGELMTGEGVAAAVAEVEVDSVLTSPVAPRAMTWSPRTWSRRPATPGSGISCTSR